MAARELERMIEGHKGYSALNIKLNSALAMGPAIKI